MVTIFIDENKYKKLNEADKHILRTSYTTDKGMRQAVIRVSTTALDTSYICRGEEIIIDEYEYDIVGKQLYYSTCKNCFIEQYLQVRLEQIMY